MYSRKHSITFLHGENVVKSLSENVIKTAGRNLQCMIKVANPFSSIQNLSSLGYLPFPLGYIHI